MNEQTSINVISLLSNIISILTPFVLLLWFYFSQKENLSTKFYNRTIGNYGNYVTAIDDDPQIATRLNAGIKFRIIDIDSQGYFRGDFFYGSRDIISSQMRAASINWYYGKLNFNLFSRCFRKVFPYELIKNRKYSGKLFILSTIDFNLEQPCVKSEYNITYYRELQALEFNLLKVYIQDNFNHRLPDNFVVYKSVGYNFEPLEAVEKVIFKNETENLR